MTEPERITPQEAREKAEREGALLVCAYEDDEKCRKFPLEDSMTMSGLRQRLQEIPVDREIIFYCA
jgi:hypothetical protein